MNERVREILSWYGSDNPGTLTNLARMLNHGRLGGTGQDGDPAGRPGLRARPGALLRAQPRGLRPALPLRARHRRRLQRLRGAARLPRGGRRRVRRRDPAHPEAQQLRLAVEGRAVLRAHRQRRRGAAPRLLGDRLHDLSRRRRCATRCTRSCATSPRRRSARASRWSCGRIRAAPASRRRARPRSTWWPTRRRSPRSSARTSSR